jgi:hypothetical protein
MSGFPGYEHTLADDVLPFRRAEYTDVVVVLLGGVPQSDAWCVVIGSIAFTFVPVILEMFLGFAIL